MHDPDIARLKLETFTQDAIGCADQLCSHELDTLHLKIFNGRVQMQDTMSLININENQRLRVKRATKAASD